MAFANYLFEAPPGHLELPDRSYAEAMLDPWAGPVLEALSWEDASAEHAESPAAVAKAARDWFKNRLQKRFKAALRVGDGGQVHHAIELQVLKNYPGAFSPRELNSFRNMRGIPGEMRPQRFLQRQAQILEDLRKRGVAPGSANWNAAIRSWRRNAAKSDFGPRQLHGSHIREWWDRHYKGLDQAIQSDPRLKPGTEPWRMYVRRYLIDARKGLDHMLQGMYSQQRAGANWLATRQSASDATLLDDVDPATGRVRPR